MDETAWWRLCLLGACVFFAGFVDSLAGGGGLITLPAYLAAGIDPSLLLGTNKLSSTIGTTASVLRYMSSLKLSLRPLGLVILAAMLASAVGARLTSFLSPEGIRWLVILALPVVAGLVFTRKDFGSQEDAPPLTEAARRQRSLFVAVPVGLYDGFFGPGAGTFFALGLTRVAHYDLLRATAITKVLNLVSNLGALFFFLLAGKVDIRLGLGMSLLSMAGHWTGSHWGLKKGVSAIRPMILLVCAGLFIKLLLDQSR